MHRDRGEEVGVARAEDGGHGAPRGEAGHEDACGVDPELRVRFDQVADDRGDRCRLAGVATLVFGEEPVPAPLRVAAAILAWIDNHEAVTVGGVVHQRC